MPSPACIDLDEYHDGQLCAAAARHFRGHLAECRDCQARLHWLMQLSVLTGQMRRPVWRAWVDAVGAVLRVVVNMEARAWLARRT